MRVDKLYLKDFKNLSEFEVDFDETKERTVLVGRNGVGKTNLLEALTWIFRNIDLRERPEFGYKINYQCSGHYVEIESSKDDKNRLDRYRLKFRLGKSKESGIPTMSEISETEFHRLNQQTRLLPKNIFGYYSGTSDRLRELFRKHEERYRDALLRGDNQTIRFLFLAKPDHSQFVLLSFFSRPDKEIRDFLKDQLSITDLDSVLFALREPYWSDPNPSQQRKEAGDERFWYAAGKVQDLLGGLYDSSLAPMRTIERVPVGIRKFKTKEHVYCFLRNEKDVRKLARSIDQKELFRRLESTQLSDLLGKLWIFFKLGEQKEPLSFDDLSEGEQQLLTVLGLLRFTAEDESLFLLDEPDTHLNPAWCLDYLDILKKHGGGLNKSQIILATHSPILFAGLDKEEVVIIEKEDGRIIARHPDSDPKGMGFSAILTSDFFGLRSILDKQTLQDLEEKRHLGGKDHRTQHEESRLLVLNEKLRKVERSNMVRDPLYREFLEAAESEIPSGLKKAVLSKQERDERRRATRKIYQETKARIERDATHKEK